MEQLTVYVLANNSNVDNSNTKANVYSAAIVVEQMQMFAHFI